MSWIELIIGLILIFLIFLICIKLIAIAFILLFAIGVGYLLWLICSQMFAQIGWWSVIVIIVIIILIKK